MNFDEKSMAFEQLKSDLKFNQSRNTNSKTSQVESVEFRNFDNNGTLVDSELKEDQTISLTPPENNH